MADLVWASDEHYADGVTDTKAEPASDVQAKGCIPGTANVTAQELNWFLNEVAARLSVSGSNPKVELFESGTGTWERAAGAKHIRLILGAGGGCGGTGGDYDTSTGGGGAGGGCMGELLIVDISPAECPAELTYTIGAGGTVGAGSDSTLTDGAGFSLLAHGGAFGSGGLGASKGTGGAPYAIASGYPSPRQAAGGDGSNGGGASASAGVDGWPGSWAMGGTGAKGLAGTTPSAHQPGKHGHGGYGYCAGGGGGGGGGNGTTKTGGSGGGGGGGYGTSKRSGDGADGTTTGGGTGGVGGAGAPGVFIALTWLDGYEGSR